jgi:hypothetical protein
MRRDGDKPLVGSNATSLGVRVPKDIEPDDDGLVRPRDRGMSVAPSARDLPSEFFPERLRVPFNKPGARGRNTYVWSMGTGPFVAGPVAPKLDLLPDKPGHGVVRPSEAMTLDAYRQALADTRDGWSIDEA